MSQGIFVVQKLNWLAYPKHPIFKNRGTMHPYGDLLGVISYASYKSGLPVHLLVIN